MPTSLTAEQILSLAPDSGAAKAGSGLASKRKWLSLGGNDRAAWGECQGSGRTPYQTQIDLAGPAFRCTCPSRKFPCKHGIGLFLLLANEPAAFTQRATPPWVAEWLAKRDQSEQQAAARQTRTTSAPDADAQKKRAAAQARTTAARETKVAAGVAELGRWLRDLVRQGLADAQSRPRSFWESMAARMVDAQAPGLARMVRELAGIPATGEGWQGRLLERLARLHLLVEGYERLDALPPLTQADIRTAIGWSQSQEELLATAGVRDRWMVLGQRIDDEDNLRVQRTWLWGVASNQPALLLAFAVANQPLDRSLVPGTLLDAELVFFPSAYPQRALVKERTSAPAALERLPGFADFSAATSAYAAALARLPWLERFPMALQAAIPSYAGERWIIRDSADDTLPLAPGFSQGWRLLALSGGRPLALFGEWDGDVLLPLSVYAEGEFRNL